MKKFILLLFIISFYSCQTNIERIKKENEQTRLQKVGHCTFKTVEYQNHSYILCERTSYGPEGIGISIVHNPGCKCSR